MIDAVRPFTLVFHPFIFHFLLILRMSFFTFQRFLSATARHQNNEQENMIPIRYTTVLLSFFSRKTISIHHYRPHQPKQASGDNSIIASGCGEVRAFFFQKRFFYLNDDLSIESDVTSSCILKTVTRGVHKCFPLKRSKNGPG